MTTNKEVRIIKSTIPSFTDIILQIKYKRRFKNTKSMEIYVTKYPLFLFHHPSYLRWPVCGHFEAGSYIWTRQFKPRSFKYTVLYLGEVTKGDFNQELLCVKCSTSISKSNNIYMNIYNIFFVHFNNTQYTYNLRTCIEWYISLHKNKKYFLIYIWVYTKQ